MIGVTKMIRGWIYQYKGELYCDYDIPSLEKSGDLCQLLSWLVHDKKSNADNFWATPIFPEEEKEHLIYAKDILARDFSDLRVGVVEDLVAEWDDGQYHRIVL